MLFFCGWVTAATAACREEQSGANLEQPAAWQLPNPQLDRNEITCRENSEKKLWLVDFRRFTAPSAQTALVSLQGLVNKTAPTLWMDHIGLNHELLSRFEAEGWLLVDLRQLSLTDVISSFHTAIRGVVLYDESSINIATSLSGLYQGLLVDDMLFRELASFKFPLLADARNFTYRKLLSLHGRQFSPNHIVEQRPQHGTFLRDFAIKNNLLTFYNFTQDTLRSIRGAEIAPLAQVYGWGRDEYSWINDLSQHGAAAVPTEYFLNLSALPCLSTALPPPPQPTPQITPKMGGKTLVAFVMTDGDNISWLGSDFISDSRFWASPLRGTMPLTWELSPTLASLAPFYLKYFYTTAKTGASGESFVAAMGLGYTFPSKNPQVEAFAEKTAALMERSKLRILSLIDDEGEPRNAGVFLKHPGIDAVLYKSFTRYDQHRGAIAWAYGKPIITFKYMLWEGLDPLPFKLAEPDDIAALLARLPADHHHDLNSFALVGVHAWSFRSRGGPLQAVKDTIARLPAQVQVVAVEELVHELRTYHPVEEKK